MEPQTNSGQFSNTVIIVGIAMLVLSSAMGAVLTRMLFPDKDGVQIGQAYTPTSSDIVASNNELHILSGSVTAISGNSITIHLLSTPQDSTLADRNIIIDYSTKIIKTVQKDDKTFQDEITVFSKKVQESKTKPQLLLQPEPFTRVTADASEISIGDIVTVTSVENIFLKKSFTASEVQFHAPIAATLKK
jgi:hypothetical protein